MYYVAGVYGEESRYNASKMTYYAQAVSLADGSVSDIELDKKDSKNELVKFLDTTDGDYAPVKGPLYL